MERTAPGWAAQALADLDAFLVDHASCERKAAAQALALVSRYPERPEIVEPMVALAREELDHFLQVFRVLSRRGVTLGADQPDPYVNGLLTALRHKDGERLLDRLIVSGLIEARSAERLALVAAAAPDPELADFYATLARSEAGHHKVFFRIAARLYPAAEVDAAIVRLAAHEAAVMRATPWRCAVH